MVSSTVVILTLRISSDKSSRAAIIFAACPGILGETVLRSTFEPENFTSTSATADFKLAESSLTLSLMTLEEAVLEEVGDGSSTTEPAAMAVGELR